MPLVRDTFGTIELLAGALGLSVSPGTTCNGVVQRVFTVVDGGGEVVVKGQQPKVHNVLLGMYLRRESGGPIPPKVVNGRLRLQDSGCGNRLVTVSKRERAVVPGMLEYAMPGNAGEALALVAELAELPGGQGRTRDDLAAILRLLLSEVG